MRQIGALPEQAPAYDNRRYPRPLLRLAAMATAPSEPISQRLSAIREQMKLLADYL
jgi:hypothetical protein